MAYMCNPINMAYKYQLTDSRGLKVTYREAADPSLVVFQGLYYLFPSMTAGFLVSDDLNNWTFHSLKDVPIYDYAPDVRVIGEYLYFSASSNSKNCSFYRTKDPIAGDFEEIGGGFPFWDPNLFEDEDGRVYFYWGCSSETPVYGVELQPDTMKPIGEPVALVYGNPVVIGYERKGENHIPKSSEEIEKIVQGYASMNPSASEESLNTIRKALGDDPYIEGAWMDKRNGKYYLQYAAPATENNIYSDGVYIADHPLGPFKLAANNPYSYKPGGFIPGAGHGSTLEDKYGNTWHASTMRVSVNHIFERRIGLWPAGFDEDGELFCNQRYGDWPLRIEQAVINPWEKPEWMLLSSGKPAKASSYEEGKDAAKATEENVQTWWKAASSVTGEWLEVDLEHECDVYAIQVNFADDQLHVPLPEGEAYREGRYIDERQHYTRWILEGSLDGSTYFVIEDKSEVETDLSHDLIVKEVGFRARYIRCTVKELPYDQRPCISGLRVFGFGQGDQPKPIDAIQLTYLSDLDLAVEWSPQDDVVGYNVLWGHAPDKLYHSHMVFGSSQLTIKALIKGQSVYVRVDSFNEVGISEGEVCKAVV
ncbi:endo-1,4-beta-xylanase [Paenibacillus sp. CCS19]|uniref:family 43 glycosylhydrolase n=1 Tax=Paenibacillus sp. CCS19 TaxID=3158387 RepID=UPI00255D6ACA|nr:family 43 glycosylhydrolase [Paenibacillus cellulosilyticus]GMK39139.1 endo-1,4-beta-xylanase [Paenibacillus cellulosilyticus]